MLTNNRILNLTWTQSAIEPMRRTAKRALHAQLVCQRCATQSRSFQSDFVFSMQLSTGRTTLLMPISRRSHLVRWDAYPCNLEDNGIVWCSDAKSTVGCGPVFNALWQQQESPSIFGYVMHCGLDSKSMQKQYSVRRPCYHLGC